MDEGEWFLYTGSGGRDLSGNKRTNKVPLSCLALAVTPRLHEYALQAKRV